MHDSSAHKEQDFARRLQQKLAASRFFTFSLLLHVILVVMGGSVVLFQRYTEPADFMSEGGVVSNETTIAPPAETPPDLSAQQTFTPEAPAVQVPIVSAITSPVARQDFKMAAVPAIVRPMAASAATDAIKKSATGNFGKAKGMHASMLARVGGTARTAAMMKNGGKDKSEQAVMAGLKWLKVNQNTDGSWSTQHKSAMTGLAILAFLGHGELPESPDFGPTVKKALDWALARGVEFQGRLSLNKGSFGGGGAVYEHAIMTYALAEYYTMTKDERYVGLLKQAVGYIVGGQAPDGGWQYAFGKGPDSDTSVSGWQIQALKAAHLTGLMIPGVDESLDKAMLNLKRVHGDKGGFGYRKKGDKYSLTGVGVLCSYFWTQDKDKMVKAGIDFLLDQSEKNYPVKYKGEKADLYAWYYHTQACLLYGGSAWSKWNRLFQDEVASAQNLDGSWPPVSGKSDPGDLQKKPDGAGPVYRTTLCILMLEVFYRYMPTTK